MRAANCDIVALDFETTGSADDCHPNMPWQIGVVVISHGVVDLSQSFQSLLRVPADHPFNPYTPGRWAQQREKLAESPTMLELWPQLRPLLTNHYLLAHHAPTEHGLLKQLFPMQKFGPWLDTLPIARRAFPRRPDYKLESLIPDLGLMPLVQSRCPDGAPHDAYYDAIACATLLEQLLAAPAWRALTLEQLARIR